MFDPFRKAQCQYDFVVRRDKRSDCGVVKAIFRVVAPSGIELLLILIGRNRCCWYDPMLKRGGWLSVKMYLSVGLWSYMGIEAVRNTEYGYLSIFIHDVGH